MKFMRLLRSYMRGIRLQAFVLTVIMTWSIFCMVYMIGKVQNIHTDLEVIKGSNYKDAYYLALFPTKDEILNSLDEAYAAETERVLEANEIVENVFAIRTANPVSYQGKSISISIIEPEMVSFFPKLKKIGIDFSKAPNGCILAYEMFSGIKTGETIALSVSGKEVSLTVAGQLDAPYHHMSLSAASTVPQAATLFDDGQMLLIQRTEENIAQVESIARRVNMDTSLIVHFRKDTTAAQREKLLSELASDYVSSPMRDLVARSQDEANRVMKQEMPLPVFLVLTSVVAHLSLSVLTIKKKEREMAITYLCGGSKSKCGKLVFAVIQIYSVVPIVLNAVIFLIWKNLGFTMEWAYSAPPEAGISAMKFRLYIATLYTGVEIPKAWPLIIVAYYLVTTVITMAVTVLTIKKNKPMVYLRGVSR